MKRLSAAGAIALALVLLLSASLFAQTAVVKKNVKLRPVPSDAQHSKRTLKPPEAVTLLEPNPKEGYYHVVTALNEDGWVWGRNLSFPTPGSGVAPFAAPPAAADLANPPLPAAGTYAIRKATCPPVGKFKKDGVLHVNSQTSNSGMLSMAKRHIPSGTTRTLTFDDFKSLQSATETAFSYDARLHKLEIDGTRNKLRNLSIPSGAISEGDSVRLAGYVTEATQQDGEKVNCYDATQEDIHINIAPKNKGREAGIVVETIPQLDNPPEWKASSFKKLATLKLQVLVIGGLTYDNEHRINDDPAHPIKGGQPWRMSLWEIHPVTRFYVCEVAACNASTLSEWTTLTAWAKANQ
jgi:hypothetical protein